MKSQLAIVLGLAAFLALPSSQAFAKKKEPNLVKSCKKECPEAKTNAEAQECAEKLEHGSDASFMKSKCYRDHEKYEAMSGKEEAGEAEHEKK